MRRGQAINVNVILGMVIFLTALGVTVILAQSALQPEASFSEQVATATANSLQQVDDLTGWTVYQVPVIIRSAAAVDDFPITASPPLPRDVIPASILLMDDGVEVPSQHNASRNRTVHVADVERGTQAVDLVYETALSVDDRTYDTAIRQDGDSIVNDDLSVALDREGFDQVTYRDVAFANDSLELGTQALDGTAVDTVTANVTYDDRTTWTTLYSGSRLIRVTHRFTGTQQWEFELTNNLSTLYSSQLGGTRSLSGSGTIYANTTDLLDLYDVRGIALIGDALTVNVSKPAAGSHIAVDVNITSAGGGAEAWLVVHDGNFTVVQPYHTMYDTRPAVTYGLPEPLRGISRQRAAELESASYTAVQDDLELGSLDYNLSIPGVLAQGRAVPGDATVAAVSYPVAVLTRFGNATQNEFAIRVWQ